MAVDEQTLGIVLRARAETATAAKAVRSDMESVEASAKKAATTATTAMSAATTSMQQGLNKTAATGRLVFPAIQASAATAGAAIGPIAGAFGSIFGAMAAGGPVMIATTLAITGIGLAVSAFTGKSKEAKQAQDELENSLRNTGTATDNMYAKLAQLNNGLDQTQQKFREWNRQLGEGMVPIMNQATGQWELYSAAVVGASNGTGNFALKIKSAQTLLSEAPTVAQYTTQINYLKEAIANASDAVIKGSLTIQLRSLNEELARLKSGGASDIKIKPSGAPSFLLFDPEADQRSADARKAIAESTNAALAESERKLQEDKAAAILFGHNREQALYQERYNAFITGTQAFQAAYGTMVNSLVDIEMTGTQRRTAIIRTFAGTAISQIAQVTQRAIFGELARRVATQQTAAVQTAVASKSAASEIAHASAVAAKWLAVAATKIYAFYAALGPFGLPAAAATIAGMIVAIKALKFHEGGIVPGSGFGDRVPAMLEPGERVISNRQYGANAPAIERAIAGQNGGGDTYIVNMPVHTEQPFTNAQLIDMRQRVERWVAPIVERVFDEGKFRRGFALSTGY